MWALLGDWDVDDSKRRSNDQQQRHHTDDTDDDGPYEYTLDGVGGSRRKILFNRNRSPFGGFGPVLRCTLEAVVIHQCEICRRLGMAVMSGDPNQRSEVGRLTAGINEAIVVGGAHAGRGLDGA